MSDGIYIASRVHHAERWRAIRAKGAPIISTWIDEAGAGESPSMSDLWERIIAEVAACSRLVVFAQTADFPLKGALVEVGAALALGKPVVACLPGVDLEERSCRPVGSWMHHPLVRRVDSLAGSLGLG